MFLHVAAGGNSDGSAESPYATLTAALTDSRYAAGDIDVVYVRGGTQQVTTHTGMVNLNQGVRLFSSGPIQMLPTQSGDQRLPFSGIDVSLSRLPAIAGGITLADNAVVSGFQIDVPTTSGANGIVGNGLSRFDIRNNVINVKQIPVSDPLASPPPPAQGIVLSGVNGSGVFRNNRVIGQPLQAGDPIGDAAGIRLRNSAAASVSVEDNTVQGFQFGVFFEDSSPTGHVKNNLFQANTDGIRFAGNSTHAFDLNIAGNRFAANGSAITSGSTGSPTTAVALIENNTFDNNSEPFFADGVNLTATLRTNQIEGRFAGTFPSAAELSRLFRIENGKLVFQKPTGEFKPNGIAVFAGSLSGGAPVSIDLTVENNSLDLQLAPAISVIYGPNANVNLRVAGNTIRRSAIGVQVTPFNAGNALASGSILIENNTITESGIGVQASLQGQVETTVRNNNVSSNAAVGIQVDGEHVRGGFTGNTTNSNGVQVDSSLTGTMDRVVGGLLISGDRIEAAIQNNSAIGNRESGFDLIAGTLLDATFDSNTASGNSGPGLFVATGIAAVAGAPDSRLTLNGNSFSGNNGGTDPEMLLLHSGSSSLNLTLTGNSSTNTVSSGFNFDLSNAGLGFVNVTPAGVNLVNTGSVGSSDGSVTIP